MQKMIRTYRSCSQRCRSTCCPPGQLVLGGHMQQQLFVNLQQGVLVYDNFVLLWPAKLCSPWCKWLSRWLQAAALCPKIDNRANLVGLGGRIDSLTKSDKVSVDFVNQASSINLVQINAAGRPKIVNCLIAMRGSAVAVPCITNVQYLRRV